MKEKTLLSLLLDSSLISRTTPLKIYNIKRVDCGDYVQYFILKNTRSRKKEGYEKEKKPLIYSHDYDIEKIIQTGTIEQKNLIRSRNEMCRLILANEGMFKTFITLTFKENITDLEYANNQFAKWTRQIKRKSPNFQYVAVPEFQKRGAVHYHLLTNIDYSNYDVICQNEKRIWKPESETWKIFKTLKYWSHGFTSAIDVTDEKYDVARYMAKYMIKDADNRLFGKRRYLYSLGLKRPKTTYLNDELEHERLKVESDFKKYGVKFTKTYKDYFGNDVQFIEIKKEQTT